MVVSATVSTDVNISAMRTAPRRSDSSRIWSSSPPASTRGPCIGSMDHAVVPSKPICTNPIPGMLVTICIWFGDTSVISKVALIPCAGMDMAPFVTIDLAFTYDGPPTAALYFATIADPAGSAVVACAPDPFVTTIIATTPMATRLNDLQFIFLSGKRLYAKPKYDCRLAQRPLDDSLFRPQQARLSARCFGDPRNGRLECAISPRRQHFHRERHNLVRYNPRSLDPVPLGIPEIGDCMDEYVARRQPIHQRRKGRTRGPLAENARPAKPLHAGREYLGSACSHWIYENRNRSGEWRGRSSVVAGPPWIYHEVQRQLPHPHRAERPDGVDEVAAETHHHCSHAARVSTQIDHHSRACAHRVDGALDLRDERGKPDVETDYTHAPRAALCRNSRRPHDAGDGRQIAIL